MTRALKAAQRALILVVEDEPLVRMFAVDVLTGAGFDVLDTASADRGIELLNQNSDIRAVVSDLEMPVTTDLPWLGRPTRASRPSRSFSSLGVSHRAVTSFRPGRTLSRSLSIPSSLFVRLKRF